MDIEGNAIDGLQGPTALPSKRLLLSILDKLQKKDTYGTFADPVDTEKISKYHVTIKHPMNFETIRKKLDGGEYANLEQFEADVLLVISNAMCYNEPADTVYYRQAQAFEELAKRNFKDLREHGDVVESESEVEPISKPRRGRPPKKNTVKPEAAAQASTEAPPGSAGNGRRLPSLRPNHGWKGNKHKSSNADAPRASCRHERGEAYSAQTSDGLAKTKAWPHVKDGSRRSTYYQEQPSVPTPQPPLPAWNCGTSNHLVALHQQGHSYAHSLARFAKDLGPIVWDMAVSRIEQVLPPGTNFGRGWVEDVGSPASIVLPTLNMATSVAPRHPSQPQPPPAASASTSASAGAMLQQFNDSPAALGSWLGPSPQASVDSVNGFNVAQLQRFLGSSAPNLPGFY
ncbi:uncharacterized protein LOC133895228 [Phragmites australis]|uniref:uncharacterized protein LOC133895228 n=1 Tax=Phragmites australis TaxID=29695 RepID=UPI002D79826D|nr:uncharacterized protein LOC133895228 [Phragmites australis]